MSQAPLDDDEAQDAAWTARQELMDRIAGMRPLTGVGRSAEAGVGVTVLFEAPRWERNTEWRLAIESFQAEAVA